MNLSIYVEVQNTLNFRLFLTRKP